MELKDYFEHTRGLGVLATADSEGRVNAAIYARPHVMDGETVAFIMTRKATHENLQSNPQGAYLFKEDGEGYKGCRLFLTKIREEKNSDKIPKLLRAKNYNMDEASAQTDRLLVYFKVNNIVPLVSKGDCPIKF